MSMKVTIGKNESNLRKATAKWSESCWRKVTHTRNESCHAKVPTLKNESKSTKHIGVEMEYTEEQTHEIIESDPKAFIKLDKDIKEACKNLDEHAARFLVDTYYEVQKVRVAIGNQSKALEKSGEPSSVLDHMHNCFGMMENQAKAALKIYSDSQYMGQWALGICGIGPVLSAALLAHIDMDRAPTVGHIWSYAGLDPNRKWISKENAGKLVNSIL